MAYIDQTTGGKRKATVMIVVAALQGAAIVALVNGLAVTLKLREPEPPLATQQWQLDPLPLPPKPPKTPELPKPRETRVDQPEVRTILTTTTPIFDAPRDPGPVEFLPIPRPEPPVALTPKFTPQSAKPSNTPSNWATTNDYPPRDLREGNQGITGFRLTVGANGRVLDCLITKSSGYAGLDKATCDKVSQRAKFKPAIDGNGQPTSGEYKSQIHWVIPE